MHRRRVAASQVAAIAISLVVISIVAFGAYGIVSMNKTASESTTRSTDSTNLGVSQTTLTCYANTTYTTPYPCSQPPLMREEPTGNSTNQTLGLELFASVNATAFSQGQAVNVSISVLNLLSTMNNVSAKIEWALPALPASFPCPRPMLSIIARGYYDTSNISTANFLPTFPPGYGLSCPNIWYSSSGYYPVDFLPRSSGTFNTSLYVNSNYSYPMSTSQAYRGYYSTTEKVPQGPNNTLFPAFLTFTTGVYTVAAGDMWGQLVLLHFTIEPNPMTTTAYTTTTCLQPTGNPVGCATMTSSSQSQSATSTYCTISAEPTGFYLHVITDGTPRPIQGAVLNATAVSTCGSQTSSQILTTNSTGWVTVPIPQISGNYFMVFQVQYTNSTTGETFSKFISQVGWAPEQGTFVTLSLPSGTVNFSYLFPISCNGVCHYMNIPQWITIVRTEPTAVTYSVQLWTNNTLKSPTITNVTLLTGPSNQTQVLKFYVPFPSYVFAGPSSFPATNTNSSSFYLVSYPGGSVIPTTYYSAGNLLYTNEEVQGWIEIYSTAR